MGAKDPDMSFDPVEEVLSDYLVRVDAEGPQLLEKLCAQYPEHAEAIRRRLEFLESLDLVERTAPTIPAMVGEFQPIRLIGRGGMGEVYLARQTSLGRLVALKLLRPGAASERFRREALAVAGLDHPNIVGVHATGEADGHPFIAMELVPGRGLDEIIADGVSIAPDRVVGWGRQIASALASAHDSGILHRDVKPSNIRVTPEDDARLVDFGLAKSLGQTTLSATGSFVGSPHYAAPEQVTARRGSLGAATDVYALGVTLYEALTGQVPFPAETPEQVFHQILYLEPEGLRRSSPQISRDLETVVMTAMAKESRQRYSSAAALGRDLECVATGRPVAVRRPGMIRRSWLWSRRQPAKAAFLVASLILFSVLGFLVSKWPDVRRGREIERRNRIELTLESAFLEYDEGVAGGSVGRFEAVLVEDPENTTAMIGLAMSHMHGEHPEETLRVLRKYDRHLIGVPEALLLQADACRDLDRSDEARRLDALYATKQTVGKSALGHFLLGGRSLRRGNAGDRFAYRSALDHFLAAVMNSDRARPLFFHEVIRTAIECDDRTIAINTALVLDRDWPDSPSTWYWAGVALSSVDPERSIDLLERFLAAQPENRAARNNLAGALSDAGRFDEASRALERILDRRPDDVEIIIGLGNVRRKNGDLAESVRLFQRALSLEPGSFRARIGLAETEIVSGRLNQAAVALEEAIETLEEAVDMEPTSLRAHTLLGRASFRMTHYESAAREFKYATLLDPSDSSLWVSWAMALLGRGYLGKNQEEAKSVLLRAVELDPKSVKAWNLLTSIYVSERRIDKLIDAASHLAELVTDDAGELTDLAVALTSAGRAEEALPIARRAIEADPMAPHAQTNLGWVLYELGRYEEAIPFLEKALELDPAVPSAQGNLDACRLILRWTAPIESASSGGDLPKDPGELAEMARTALLLERYRLCVRVYRAAFGADPKLIELSPDHCRFRAACAAASAGCGKGKDADGLSGAERAGLLDLAVGWMTDELEAWESLYDDDKISAEQLKQTLRTWKVEPLLEGVRARARESPPNESRRWRDFWGDVEDLHLSLKP